jgi:nucleotide-binding universal stress UspA family protein
LLSIKKILVAIDGSNPSLDASDYAIDLAKTNVAELIVLYIVSVVPSSQFEYDNIGRMKEIETEETEKAEQVADKVKQKAIEKNVSAETTVLVKYTKISKEIIEYAEKMEVDLIVVGNRGRTGFKKMLLGSVSTEVVTYAHCPVLVVR